MTRDPESRRARELAALPSVELFKGSFANEDDLTNGFKDCDGAVRLIPSKFFIINCLLTKVYLMLSCS